MFSIIEIINLQFVYFLQTDFYKLTFPGIFIILILVELVPAQIPEIELIQLGPGSYFFLLFICLVCLLYFSNLFSEFPLEINKITAWGVKEKPKMLVNIVYKTALVYLFIILICILNSLIPLSLDGFISSLDNTIEDAWSLPEVLIFESCILILLIAIAELPLKFFTEFNTEVKINKLLPYWKYIIMGSLLIAGFATPTLDGYTQLSFSISTYLFYLILVNTLKKRLVVKNVFSLILG